MKNLWKITVGLILVVAACAPTSVEPAATLVAPSATAPVNPSAPISLLWHRSGGLAGFCDVLVVSTDGAAQAAPCNADAPTRKLSDAERLQLQQWAVQFGSVVVVAGDPPGVADGLLITLEMQGRGAAQPADATQQQMLAWAEGVYARLIATP